jgi:tricorn protease
VRYLLLIAALVLAAGRPALADAEKPLLLQRPTLSKTHIAFTYAGDLWTVPRAGGEARRLTSGVGLEFNPIFSPDGRYIAFSGEYDGNIDVYVIPAAGGEPRRLTYHPAVDTAVGWTPDGRAVLFSSGRASSSRFNKLFTIPVEGGGLPTELPLPTGEQAAFSPDGSQLAYVPHWNRRAVPNAYIAWKRYRGGLASPVWIASLDNSHITRVPRDGSNDFCPMWLGGKLYFLSDRLGRTTLFSYDPSSKQVHREVDSGDKDLSWASAGPDAIVYEQFGSLHLFDPKSGRPQRVDVRLASDFPGTRPRYEKVGKKITGSAVSPNGARAVFEARGEIFTVPAEKGDVRNLTHTPGVAERDPAWSPDGKTIAYFSDESGEYMLHLRDARGQGQARRLALGDAPNFYSRPVWSPDSKRIAYGDNRLQLWYIDVATGQSKKVDTHSYFNGPDFDVAWSPDARWLAYTKVMDNRLRAAFLLDTTSGKRHQVTDAMSDVRHLAFDRNGKYLYFTASTDIGPTTNGIDMSGMNRPVTRSVYLVVLDRNLPSPLSPESDEEKERSADKDQPDKAEGRKVKKGPAVTRIDAEGIGQRILGLPLPARNYVGLQTGKADTVLVLERPVMPAAGGRA